MVAALTGTVAVTGGTGFVGQAVLDEAGRRALLVRALTRRPPPGDERSGVAWVRGTLEDDAALADLMRGSEAVIHIAGLTNTPDISAFARANVAGTENVVAAARAAAVRRFVFVSSLSAREPDRSQYGRSKALAEEVVKTSGLDWTIVRPPAVYGPRDKDMLELFRAAQWGFVPAPAKGATSIIHVDDLARLLFALPAGGEGVSGTVLEPDDGTPGGYDHGDLARLIGRAMGRRIFVPRLSDRLLTLAARADRFLRGDGAKLTADRVGYMTFPDWVCRLDRAPPKDLWAPQISGEDGLRSTAEWYRAKGWL